MDVEYWEEPYLGCPDLASLDLVINASPPFQIIEMIGARLRRSKSIHLFAMKNPILGRVSANKGDIFGHSQNRKIDSSVSEQG